MMGEERRKENYRYQCGHVDYRNIYDKPAAQPKQTLRRKIYRMMPDKDLVVFWTTTVLLVVSMLALIAVSGSVSGSGRITTFIPIRAAKSTILMPMRF